MTELQSQVSRVLEILGNNGFIDHVTTEGPIEDLKNALKAELKLMGDFSSALIQLDKGIYMSRKGMRGDVVQVCLFRSVEPKEMDYYECKSPEGEYQPWTPSHKDMQAKDWFATKDQIK